jgi:hypothetical protein
MQAELTFQYEPLRNQMKAVMSFLLSTLRVTRVGHRIQLMVAELELTAFAA